MPAWMPDVNILVYAMRRRMPQSDWAFTWLRTSLKKGDTVAVPDVVLAGALRVATRQGPNWHATPIQEAIDFCQALVDHPAAVLLRRSGGEWEQLRRLCSVHQITGPRVRDALLAAIALDAGCRLVTSDRGFGVYAGLTWLHLPDGQLRTNPT